MSATLVQPHLAARAVGSHVRFLWAWALPAAVASGLAMAACFAPLNLHVLAWIALVPLLTALPRMTADQAWLYGLAAGLVYYGLGLGWVYALGHALGAIFLFEFALLMGFSFRVARILMERFGTAAMLWAVPLAFVGQEVLRCEAHSRLRFAFGAWGYSQAHNPWIAQLASIGGVYFLSFVLVLVSAAVAHAIVRPDRRAIAAATACIAGVLVLGLIAQPGDYADRPPVPVACIQGENLAYPQYARLAEQALADPTHPRLVVMPEHALPGLFAQDDPAIELLAALARRYRAYVCAAGDTQVPTGPACPFDNVAWLIGLEGRIVLRQLKAVPIPFFRDGNPARTQEVTDTPWGRVGIFVCYDGTFTDVPRRLVDLGADLLLAPVMDVQDWPDQQRRQHADLAVFRAIELRRCVVRAASSGISQVIDATGRVTAVRTKDQGPGVLTASVYVNAERTVFARGGWLFAPAAGLAFLAATVVLTAISLLAKVRRWIRRGESITTDPMWLVYGMRPA